MFNVYYKFQFERKYNNLFIFSLILISLSCLLFLTDCNRIDQPSNAVAITFESEESKLHGYFFPANTNEPAPTVILCHGGPGKFSGKFVS